MSDNAYAEMLLASNVQLLLFLLSFWLVVPFRKTKNFIRIS